MKHVDVAIIGGAAMGASIAWFLSRNPDFDGTVAVVERDSTYRHSSTALSVSSVRHLFSNAVNVEISLFTSEFVPRFADWYGDGAPDLNLVEQGYLMLADAAREDILLENHAVQTASGAHTLLLSPAEIRSRFPFVNTTGVALGHFNPRGSGWFDGYAMMQAMRKQSKALGVTWIEDEVTGITRKGDTVTGIHLGGGKNIECRQLVNAAGPRAGHVAALAGIDLPVEPRKRSVFVFSCASELSAPMPLLIDPSGVFCRPEGSHFITGISPTPDPLVEFDDFDVRYDEFEDVLWPVLAARVPQFESIRQVNAWAGHYAYNTIDQNALLGPHPEAPNFLFANGFSGHGLQQAPGIGRGIAEWLCYGEYRSLDLGPLAVARLTNNERLVERAII